MKVLIVGAGIGGLACAIACRRENLDVVVVEQAPEIHEIGAGIQIPPNGTRILRDLELLPQIIKKGIVVDSMDFRRYCDGSIIRSMVFGDAVIREYGTPWVVIHRRDYHQVLLKEAERLGAHIRMNCTVEKVLTDTTEVVLASEEKISGDVIVGADGLWSVTRQHVLSTPITPVETGDMAYRATFSAEELETLGDKDISKLCSRSSVTGWLGPRKHAVFYPVKPGGEFNLVLLVPDNMAVGSRRESVNLGEISQAYYAWDKRIQKIISCIPASVVKWKLNHLPELPTWTENRTTLLGDACHPMLPYQAQAAAMAVEDAATLGKLLGFLERNMSIPTMGIPEKSRYDNIPDILRVYESLRKPRTTEVVNAAARNQVHFHREDGPMRMVRDLLLKGAGITPKTDWTRLATSRWRRILRAGGLESCELVP